MNNESDKNLEPFLSNYLKLETSLKLHYDEAEKFVETIWFWITVEPTLRNRAAQFFLERQSQDFIGEARTLLTGQLKGTTMHTTTCHNALWNNGAETR